MLRLLLLGACKLLEMSRYIERRSMGDDWMLKASAKGVDIPPPVHSVGRRMTWLTRCLPSKVLVYAPGSSKHGIPAYVFRKSFFMSLHPILVHVMAAFTCSTPLRMPQALHPSTLVRSRAQKRKLKCSRSQSNQPPLMPKTAYSAACSLEEPLP